ncbi:hypothetical protein ACH68I_12130 [Klebsiella aerogenes]|uniref:hypothetical protein n=1 Tax=Klebsiella aerogenes TaxID=548 RepID=UPI003787D362
MNNELTAALLTIEKCRELSGCPAGVDLQDWVKQLAAENVALRAACGGDGSYRNCPACTFSEYIEAPKTPATDRIVAGIKADGVALAKSAFEKHIQSTSCYQDEMVGMESALSIACQVESQLREGADK